MDNLLFALNAVAPTFLVVALGWLLRRCGIAGEEFVRRSSQVVFYVALPAMIALEMLASDFRGAHFGRPVALFVGATLAVFAATWMAAARRLRHGPSVGAFVQGSFRTNIAIVGLPVLAHLLGERGLVPAVVLLAVAMPVYNVLAVLVLSATGPRAKDFGAARLAREVAANPLVLGVVAGLALRALPAPPASFLLATAKSLGQLAFPLGLLGIGASLSRAMLTARLGPVLWASVAKTVLLPLAVCGPAWALGIRDAMLVVLFVVAGGPTAVASFAMAKAMDSDAELAAGIVLCSTIGSALTLAAGIYVLRLLGAV